jgi:hypothetical protein
MMVFLRLAFPEFQIVELAIRGIVSTLRRASSGHQEPQIRVRESSSGARGIRPRVLD